MHGTANGLQFPYFLQTLGARFFLVPEAEVRCDLAEEDLVDVPVPEVEVRYDPEVADD